MRQTIWWIFFGKDLFLVPGWNVFWRSEKKHYRNVFKTNSYLFRKPVDEIYFFDFSNVFDTYSDFGRKCFWLLAKKSSRKVVKLHFFAFSEYTWMKTIFFLKKCFWFDFRTSSEAVSDYQQIFYRAVVKTVLYVFRKQIEESDFSQIFWFSCIFGLQAKPFATLGNFSLQICQNCFLRVQTNSLIKRTFEKISYPFFVGLWSKYFLTLAKNCT